MPELHVSTRLETATGIIPEWSDLEAPQCPESAVGTGLEQRSCGAFLEHNTISKDFFFFFSNGRPTHHQMIVPEGSRDPIKKPLTAPSSRSQLSGPASAWLMNAIYRGALPQPGS